MSIRTTVEAGKADAIDDAAAAAQSPRVKSVSVEGASSSGMFDAVSPAELSTGQIEDRLVGYAGQIASLTARFLELLGEFEERGGWSGWGILSCAHWLSLRAGVSKRTAHEYVRVARALRDLPGIRGVFGRGELSYSKVRALTRVATPERERELLNVALSADANQLERVVRAIRGIDQREREQDCGEVESTGSWRWKHDGTLMVSMRLSALDGASFLAAVVRAEYERTRTVDDAGVPLPDIEQPDGAPQSDAVAAMEGPTGQVPGKQVWRHTPANIAPAMMVMADLMRTSVEVPVVAPGADVLVHTYADDTAVVGTGAHPDGARPGGAHLDEGPALSAAEIAEVECDGSQRVVGHAPDNQADSQTGDRKGRLMPGGRGSRVAVWGRKRRVPNRSMVQVVVQRDGCCRYPGCGRTRRLHVHHVRFWSRGGHTHPDNLILLCATHHRSLHRDEFAIQAHALQQFTFHGPDGSLIESAPPISAPSGWMPAPISDTAAVPVSPGRLDLGYTTEVLYAAWQLRHQRQRRAELAVADATENTTPSRQAA